MLTTIQTSHVQAESLAPIASLKTRRGTESWICGPRLFRSVRWGTAPRSIEMPVTTEEKKGGKSKKGQEQKVVTGTMKPLPTSEGQAKDPAKETELEKMAREQNEAKAAELAKKKAEIEEKRAKLKALQEELKKEKDAEAQIKAAEKAAKEAEKNAAKKAREEAEAKIKEADAAVTAAEEALKLTEEWAELEAAKAVRAAIGPLPKVRKTREGGGGGGRKAANGLTPNMIKVLQLMEDGEVRTASEIAVATEILKGKRLPELVQLGALEELVPDEGKRGKRFQITDSGKEQLAKALAEE